MKGESTGAGESETMTYLLEKIASLSQSQLAGAADALAMVWNDLTGPLNIPALDTKPASFTKPTIFQNRYGVKLALLKSIRTGTFVDVQFYAYNSIDRDSPVDLKPLFVSSIVIEEWRSAITTRKVYGFSQFVLS
jgi:hypothetical protein